MFNTTVIIGRLGNDPEIFKTKNDLEIATFSIAHTEKSGDRENTQWHTIKAFGKQAAACHKYLSKGDLCCIEGRIDIRTYEKDGETRKVQSIIAEHIMFLSPRRRKIKASDLPECENIQEA